MYEHNIFFRLIDRSGFHLAAMPMHSQLIGKTTDIKAFHKR